MFMLWLWSGRIATHLCAREEGGFTPSSHTPRLPRIGNLGVPMRRLSLALTVAGAAAVFSHNVFAADLPMKAAPRMPVAVSDPWTGFYIGATAGGGFGKAST